MKTKATEYRLGDEQTAWKILAPAFQELRNELEGYFLDVVSLVPRYLGHKCESPIEMALVAAWMLRTVHYSMRGENQVIQSIDLADSILNDDALSGWVSKDSEDLIAYGSQVPVGKYRADFVFRRVRLYRNAPASDPRCYKPIFTPALVVECDGHNFHERTKDQAASDRSRDRELTAEGFVVMRFTGSEIWRNAYGCIKQVDEYLLSTVKRIEAERFERLKRA